MANHDELVAEMLALEQMGTQERQKLAKKRRIQQLKKWSQREKEWIAKEKQLNKRLANILNEENNGLNLKQYTTYDSNQRTKKQHLTNTTSKHTSNNNNSLTSHGNNLLNGLTKLDNVELSTNSSGICASESNIIDKKAFASGINNNSISNNNNNLNSIVDGPYSNNMSANGRVHFNVGVMLLEAAARNDYDEVRRLLSLGVSPDSVNHDGLTALHQCCIDASEPIMNLLLEYGADVDARDTERWTPLHAACTCGHLNLVKILVEHNADLLAVNGDGNMPFDICEDEATLDYIESQMIKRGITQEMIDLTRASSEIQMLSHLEELAASSNEIGKNNLNFADENGVTQLHIAATNNYQSVVEFLLKHDVNVNVCDNDRWTPLHGVACWGNDQHIKVAELLVDAGADLDARTSNDETVLDLCDNVELLERLNLLKDELESKHAIGTDRLKRTQSRTNSRIHSVRRTRVQDKNQISRREAREEAMLRVESSENLNSDNGGPSQPSALGTKKSSSESVEVTQLQPDSLVKQQQNRLEPPLVGPVETNLDHTQLTIIDNAKTLDNQASDDLDSTTDLNSFRSQQKHELHMNINGSNSTQIVCDSENVKHSQRPANTSKQNNVTTMQVLSTKSSHNNSQTDQDNSTAQLSRTCDVSERQQKQSSTVVQVQFAPINYTLSNLKKHRSDLRLRGTGVVHSSVQLDPEPMLSIVSDDSRKINLESNIQANGWSNASATSATTSSFKKFHGEPSEAIEDNRRRGLGCCTII